MAAAATAASDSTLQQGAARYRGNARCAKPGDVAQDRHQHGCPAAAHPAAFCVDRRPPSPPPGSSARGCASSSRCAGAGKPECRKALLPWGLQQSLRRVGTSDQRSSPAGAWLLTGPESWGVCEEPACEASLHLLGPALAPVLQGALTAAALAGTWTLTRPSCWGPPSWRPTCRPRSGPRCLAWQTLPCTLCSCRCAALRRHAHLYDPRCKKLPGNRLAQPWQRPRRLPLQGDCLAVPAWQISQAGWTDLVHLGLCMLCAACACVF